MKSTRKRYLLDVNSFVALADPDHVHYRSMLKWFADAGDVDWGICSLTEAGFVRVTTSPTYSSPRTIAQARAILARFSTYPGFRYWPLIESWIALSAPFSGSVFGHQQVTESYLLGLAIKEKGVLVTFDRRINALAGSTYSRNVLVLS